MTQTDCAAEKGHDMHALTEFLSDPTSWMLLVGIFLIVDAIVIAVVVRQRKRRSELFLTGLDGYDPAAGTQLVQYTPPARRR